MSNDTLPPLELGLLQVFYRHHLWSNSRLFEACLNLNEDQLAYTDPGTFGSIRATLAHLVRAEEHYLFLLTGQAAPEPKADVGVPLVDLHERVRLSGEKLLQLIATVRPEATRQVGTGDQIEHLPVAVFFLQAIHHAHEHRTQVATLLGQQGIEPPGISGWAYYEEEMVPSQE